MIKRHGYIKLKLILASGLTLVVLIILLSIPLLGLFFLSEVFSLKIIFFFSFSLNLVLFIVSPSLLNSELESQYIDINWKTPKIILNSYPISCSCIEKICKKYKISEPKIAIVDDKTPLAFTYGNSPRNARILITSELVNLLEDEELAAVYAHELGHILRYDVAVMTLAQTIVVTLYIFGEGLLRSNNDSSNLLVTKMIGLISFVFYYIGLLSSLYLSRVRELSADCFAAKNINDPNALSRALVKILYRTNSIKHINNIAKYARALNIFDLTVKSYKTWKDSQEVQELIKDLLYPSSHWNELFSTHPSPIKRIKALSFYSKQKGIDTTINISEIIYNLKQIEIHCSKNASKKNKIITDVDFQAASKKIMMRKYRVSLALGSLFFTFGGFLFLHEVSSQDKILSILCIILGISCAFIFVYSILNNTGYILLTSAGIEIKYTYLLKKNDRIIFFKWSDIEEIGISNFYNTKQVGFNFSDNYQGEMRSFSSSVTKVFIDYDFVIADLYEQKPEKLFETLHRWKRDYT